MNIKSIIERMGTIGFHLVSGYYIVAEGGAVIRGPYGSRHVAVLRIGSRDELGMTVYGKIVHISQKQNEIFYRQDTEGRDYPRYPVSRLEDLARWLDPKKSICEEIQTIDAGVAVSFVTPG